MSLRLPAHLAHSFKNDCCVLIHALGSSLQWSRQDGGELRRVLRADTSSRSLEVVKAGRLRSVNAGSPFDYVEVELQDALLAENEFSHWHEREFCAFTKDRAVRPKEQVLYELLGDGGGSACAAAVQVVF